MELELLTRRELAKMLKVGMTTLDLWTAQGMPRRYVGSLPRFVYEEVQVWLNAKGEESLARARARREKAKQEGARA